MIDSLYTLLSSSLKDGLETLESDFRVFPYSYLPRFRKLVETKLEWSSEDLIVDDIKGDQLIVVLNISCGELSDYANEVISVVADGYSDFRVVQGTPLSSRPPVSRRVESTTSVNELSRRTTRQVHNSRPITMNPLSAFTCTRLVPSAFLHSLSLLVSEESCVAWMSGRMRSSTRTAVLASWPYLSTSSGRTTPIFWCR